MLVLPKPNGLNKHCPDKVFATYLGVNIPSPSSMYGFCNKMATARPKITVYATTLFFTTNKQGVILTTSGWNTLLVSTVSRRAVGLCSPSLLPLGVRVFL